MISKIKSIALYGAVLALLGMYSIRPASAQQTNMTGNINIFFGQKLLDKDDWEPVEKQTEFGIEADLKQVDWPVSVVIGYSRSNDSGTDEYDPPMDAKGTTTELTIGAKKIWDQPSGMHPFFAGGLAFVSADVEAEIHTEHFWMNAKDSGDALGFWLGAGLYWTIAEAFNVGLSLRYSDASVDLMDESTKAGGFHYGVIAGYHF